MAVPNIFSPPLADAASTAPVTRTRSKLVVPITVYTLPSGAPLEDTLNLALLCALCCSSTEGTRLQWKSLIATYIHALTEGIVDKLPTDQFSMVPLSPEAVKHMREWYTNVRQAENNAGSDVTDPHPKEVAALMLPKGVNLPVPPTVESPYYISLNRNVTALAAHQSLVVFLAGKQVDDNNRSALTDKRPRALIDKYRIEYTDLLNGAYRISDRAHKELNQAWLEMTTLKAACFREYATYTHKDTDLQEDILLTTINLMRFMQMQHAVLIHKFLLAYPWAKEFPPLRRFVAIFEQSMISASKIDPHLQPFIKIIYGDKSGLFPRKDLGPLIACALATEQETSETLRQYFHDESYGSIVNAFLNERTHFEELRHKKAGGAKEKEVIAPVPADEDMENI